MKITKEYIDDTVVCIIRDITDGIWDTILADNDKRKSDDLMARLMEICGVMYLADELKSVVDEQKGNVGMIELKKYADDEYKVSLKKELEEDGLYESVRKRLDIINIISSDLKWLKYAYVQEMMCEILDLIELR